DRPVFVQDPRDALELHIARKTFYPGLEVRLERIAVGAAVPEELDDLDLALGVDRLGRPQLDIVCPLDWRAQGAGRKGDEQAGHGAREAKSHGIFSLGRFNSWPCR